MYPLFCNDTLVCPHQGIVHLNSDKGKVVLENNQGIITESDLQNASIIGCSHNILGVPKPCTKLMAIPPTALSESIVINGEKVVLADKVCMIMTDNGVPLQLQSKSKHILSLNS